MPVPPKAAALPEPISPRDVLDVTAILSKEGTAVPTGPDGGAPFLLADEDIASFTIATTAEAAALGFQVKSGGKYDPVVIGTKVQFWVGVLPGMRSSAVFLGEGIKLGAEFVGITTNDPPREKEKTIVFQVAKQ